MFRAMKKFYYGVGASITTGLVMAANDAQAAAGNTFSTIAENINTSISSVPGLITGLSYLLGLVLGVLGVMKIKDHVENPQQNPLKEGAIRLAAGGALFALPILFDSMLNTINGGGGTAATTKAATLNKVDFAVK